jgi:hypothetical protein
LSDKTVNGLWVPRQWGSDGAAAGRLETALTSLLRRARSPQPGTLRSLPGRAIGTAVSGLSRLALPNDVPPAGGSGSITATVTPARCSGVGRDCRDAFLGLAKTCDRLGIAVWDYLGSRLRLAGHVIVQPLDYYVRGRFRPA